MENMFGKLLKKAEVLTIYGNYDNLDVILRLELGMLMENAMVYKYEGLEITSTKDIVSRKIRG